MGSRKAKAMNIDKDPEGIRKAVQKLSFAYRRSKKQLDSELKDAAGSEDAELNAVIGAGAGGDELAETDELSAQSDCATAAAVTDMAGTDKPVLAGEDSDREDNAEVDDICEIANNMDDTETRETSQAELNLVADVAPADQDELMSDALRRAEAVLFAAGQPLSAQQISEVLPHGVDAPEILMALKAAYENRGVSLVEVAGRWRFQTSEDLAFLFVEERHEQKKLTQAALETLAIIAYGQPVTRAEIEAVRGVAVSKTTIDTLMETGWVRIKGRRKTPGRPVTLGTTDAFLEHFGLESLDVLPGKADLEAEGLLSDVVPEGFDTSGIIPEELDEIDDSLEDLADDTSFIMDFMDDGAADADASES